MELPADFLSLGRGSVKGWHDSYADLVDLNLLSMDSSGHHRVRGDSGSHLNSLVSVDGRKVSHGPSIHEQGQAT